MIEFANFLADFEESKNNNTYVRAAVLGGLTGYKIDSPCVFDQGVAKGDLPS